jgi:hypothetical protein
MGLSGLGARNPSPLFFAFREWSARKHNVHCVITLASFMMRSMDMAQSDSGEIRPTDPDMHWTGWALDKLREIVDLDIRAKRTTVREQERTQ